MTADVLLFVSGSLFYVWARWVVPLQFRRAQQRMSSSSRVEFERVVAHRWMIRALAVVKISGITVACLGAIGVVTSL
jgi:hypothetical protein